MSPDRPITIIQCYKREVFLLLTILLFFSLIVISIDQHFNGFSKKCLICQTRISINGISSISDSSILKFSPTITYYFLEENLFNFTIPLVSPFQNKSPPPIHLLIEELQPKLTPVQYINT
jgi:hypothetical protein